MIRKRLKAAKGARRRKKEGGGGGDDGDVEQKQCPKCQKYKKAGPSLSNHMKRCGVGPEKVKCDHCEMEFKRKEDMQAHALIHMGQVTCPIHNILFRYVGFTKF